MSIKEKPIILCHSHDFEEQIQITEKQNYVAVKDNRTIQNRHFVNGDRERGSLSLNEQKILLCLISTIKPDDTHFREQTFDIKEFCKICGIDAHDGATYKKIRENIEDLACRVMWLIDNDSKTETLVRWLSTCVIEKNSSKIRLKLDDNIAPYLMMISNNYTRIPIHSIVRMKSKYSILIYELLKSYQFQGNNILFSLEDLRQRLDCEHEYENFYNFRKRVIEKAVEDINKYTELEVEVNYLKNGKAYSGVIFQIRDLSKREEIEDIEELERRYNTVEDEILGEQYTLFEDM